VFVAAAEFDLLLGDVRSLKQKRAVVRPIVAALRRQEVAAAEVRYADLHRRAVVAVATVAPTARMCAQVLDRCEDLVAGRPEVELLSVRRRLFGDEDEE
jgi:uncharacterized protein YlxP (DUF503 family)